MSSEAAAGTHRRSAPVVVRIQNWLSGLLGLLAGAALLALTVLITVHVCMRYLAGSGIRGADELSSYLFIAVVYGGLAIALRDGAFIKVELLHERLPRALRGPVTVLVRLISLAFIALVTWRSWQLMLASYSSGLESIGVLRILLWIPQATIAVGCLALLLQVAVSVIWPAHVDPPGAGAVAADSVPAADGTGTDVTVRRDGEAT